METLKLKKGFKRGPDGFIYDIGKLKAAIELHYALQKLPFYGFIEGNPTFPDQSKECQLLFHKMRHRIISRNEFESNPVVQEYKKEVDIYTGVHQLYTKYLKDVNYLDVVDVSIHHCAIAYISGKRHLKVCAVQPCIYGRSKRLNEFLKKKLLSIMVDHSCQRFNISNYYKNHEEKCTTKMPMNHTCTERCFDNFKCEECLKHISFTRGHFCAVKLTLEDNREIAEEVLNKYQVSHYDIHKVIDDYER